ncbi:MAG: hypothetical protein ACWA5P_01045 [bacterium]
MEELDQLLEALNTNGKLPLVIKQLNKDFLLANVDFGLNDEIPTLSFKLMFLEYLNELIIHDSDKLQRVLYKVDISEEVYQKNLVSNTSEFTNILATLILKRELKKVNYRLKYS